MRDWFAYECAMSVSRFGCRIFICRHRWVSHPFITNLRCFLSLQCSKTQFKYNSTSVRFRSHHNFDLCDFVLTFPCSHVATRVPSETRFIVPLQCTILYQPSYIHRAQWHLPNLFPMPTTSASTSISSPSFTATRYATLRVLLTPGVSQDPSSLARNIGRLVQLSKMVATAPPCRLPHLLHRSGVIIIRSVAQGVGLYDANTILSLRSTALS